MINDPNKPLISDTPFVKAVLAVVFALLAALSITSVYFAFASAFKLQEAGLVLTETIGELAGGVHEIGEAIYDLENRFDDLCARVAVMEREEQDKKDFGP